MSDDEAQEEPLPGKLDPFVPDLKTLIVALRVMEKDPKSFTMAVRHTLMVAEAAKKTIDALEARVAALEEGSRDIREQLKAAAFMRP